MSLSLPSTRVDAFNVTLAQELSRNGRRTGLTFAPEGGSERIRRVINKMVSEEDLIRTVVTAYANGWRQVKLYFMCGLPTETDDDVVQIARLAHDVIKAGRGPPAGVTSAARCPSAVRAQAAHPVPVGGAVPAPRPWTAGSGCSAGELRATGPRQGDRVPLPRRKPVHVEGLLSRGDRRVGAVIRAVWQDGGRFDGWSETSPTTGGCDAPRTALAGTGVDLDWYTTRERGYEEMLPWDHLDSGLDRDWLWQDWQDAIDRGASEVDDCRWTPCFECGVCPAWAPRSRSARAAGSCCR